MRWRGAAQKTEAPRHNQPLCTTDPAAPLWTFLIAGALDVHLKETIWGSDNRCHHVAIKVVKMGQGYSLKTTALLRYEDLFEEPSTSYKVC